MEVIHRNIVETEFVISDDIQDQVSPEALEAFRQAGEVLAQEFFDHIYKNYSSLQHFKPKYIRITLDLFPWDATIRVFGFAKQVYHQLKDDNLSCIAVQALYSDNEHRVVHCGNKSEVFHECAEGLYELHQQYGTISQDTEIRWTPEMCIEYLRYQMMCERIKPVTAQAVNILINDWQDADEARERDCCYHKDDED